MSRNYDGGERLEENEDYRVYRYGDDLKPGYELKVEHSVSCENVDISALIAMGTESLEAMCQGSIDGEQKAYEIVLAAAKQWEQQAAVTQKLTSLPKALQTQKAAASSVTHNEPVSISRDCFMKHLWVWLCGAGLPRRYCPGLLRRGCPGCTAGRILGLQKYNVYRLFFTFRKARRLSMAGRRIWEHALCEFSTRGYACSAFGGPENG